MSFSNFKVSFLHVASPFAISKLRKTHRWVARRLETAKGTAQGISLSGIVFPQPPDHNKQPKFRHKKTARSTGCGFARLLEFLSSVEKSIIMCGGSCQAVVPASWPNQCVEQTRGTFASFKVNWWANVQWLRVVFPCPPLCSR